MITFYLAFSVILKYQPCIHEKAHQVVIEQVMIEWQNAFMIRFFGVSFGCSGSTTGQNGDKCKVPKIYDIGQL